jgi:hypothetical protein
MCLMCAFVPWSGASLLSQVLLLYPEAWLGYHQVCWARHIHSLTHAGKRTRQLTRALA